MELPGGLTKDPVLSVLWLILTAVDQVQSPDQELLHAAYIVKKKKKKERNNIKRERDVERRKVNLTMKIFFPILG